jgi:pimeloyl-ACP methyl ester carboxylesterase
MSSELNFKIIGQGDPVIILHGLFGMLDNLQSIAKKLETEGFMSFLIDQRDHGRSKHTSAFNYQLLADDLSHFMEDNWIHETMLIGHSMGGKTCLKYLSQNPSAITKCIIIDIGIKKYESGHQQVFDALFSVPINKIESRDEVEIILMEQLKNWGTVQFLMKNLSRKKSGGFEWKMNLNLIYKEYENILDEVTFSEVCETEICFIRGADSNYITDNDIISLKPIFPNSKFVTIPKAGHWVHVDQPNELFNEIITFING